MRLLNILEGIVSLYEGVVSLYEGIVSLYEGIVSLHGSQMHLIIKNNEPLKDQHALPGLVPNFMYSQ